MEVVFSQRAIAAVMAETAEKIQTETGGLFLGKVIDLPHSSNDDSHLLSV